MYSQTDTILEVDGVYKRYGKSSTATRKQLSEIFVRSLIGLNVSRTEHREKEFWGLRNINFTLDRGNAIGVIGFNGAGKTSLLRVLGGQMLPDRGEVRILGNSASFIDLGAGFNPSLSGRENIFIKGAILGRSREEMEAVADSIVSFAELGDFIDSPVKTYSSGMNARLGFAIVTHVDPSLLLIDEILAVGDFHFRQKCLKRVREMRERSSFVLVSHNMRDVRTFCDEVIVLERGSIAFKGKPDEAIEFYEESEARLKGANQPEEVDRFKPRVFGHLVKREEQIEDVQAFWARADGEPISAFKPGDDIGIKFSFRLKYEPRHLRIGIPTWNQDDVLVTAFATFQNGKTIIPDADGRCEGFLSLKQAPFNPGALVAIIAISDGPEFLCRHLVGEVSVEQLDSLNYWGVTHMPHEWRGLDIR
ncbi:polysaccharide ABC transporter ATP-binding protein [Maricaulaceae bacterium NA33B04]|nr:polysaccharide ABC transporter ATP-binding protein [Maricaulaceae bacterium NA33B04]